MGILRTFDDVVPSVLGPEIVSQAADETEIAALRQATEGFRDQLEKLEVRSASVSGSQKEELAAEAEEIEQRIDEAEAALGRFPVRMLEVHEHPALLAEALTSAQERLLIVSPWIRSAVVDDDFVEKLKVLIQRSVHVTIAYGIGDSKQGSAKDRAVEQELVELSRSCANFDFIRLGDTHAKILILDERFVVVTSYNWLSFRGDPDRPFRDERGTLVSIPAEIDRVYSDYMSRIENLVAGSVSG
jgi:phosphatidylserine/phosphatidylglycerophosphate/cardiolipin synthase-like enzyme